MVYVSHLITCFKCIKWQLWTEFDIEKSIISKINLSVMFERNINTNFKPEGY